MSGRVHAQQVPPTCESAMQSHYEAAQRLQSSHDTHQATLEFRLFLSQALRCIGNARAQLGEYSAAAPLFERATILAPNDELARLDFASAALAANDLTGAKQILQTPAASAPTNCAGSLCARSQFLLGRLLFSMGDIRGAVARFQAAVREEPTYEHGYALARAELALGDKTETAALFREMVASFSDTAAIHMDYGRAYAEADFPDEAIVEFRKSMAKDSSFPDVHYCLGAAFLLRSGAASFPEAEAEFHKELALHPDDAFSLSQLGYIAMTRHDLTAAENNLRRAATLSPDNPDNFLLLGEIYTELDRPADAEAALRSAIAATIDPSRNHYQVRGAHYQLGRLLLRAGKTQEAAREMAAAQELLLQNRTLDQVNISGKPLEGREFPRLAPIAPDPAALAALRAFEHRLAPAIADSYNNLGASMASDKLYAQALPYFEQAFSWNPETEGLDSNWGRAAFAAKAYPQATVSLERYLKEHPSATAIREPLGMSYFMLARYRDTLRVLDPIRAQLPTSPLLYYAYAEALLHNGEISAGIIDLQSIRQAHPELSIVALGLGRALAEQQRYEEAEPQLRTAYQLRPKDPEAQYQLAFVLFTRNENEEAERLLQAFATPVATSDPELLRSIAALQAAHAQPAAARVNLDAAAKLKAAWPKDLQSVPEPSPAILR